MLRRQDKGGLSRLCGKDKKWLRSYDLRQLPKNKSISFCTS